MSTPYFSIIVPTRQRPDTLFHTLKTLISQDGDDYEIIIADNFGDEEVTRVISEAQEVNASIRHIRSDRILPMGENWERGLSACRGRYVTIIGDDDGFLPSTLRTARHLLQNNSVKILNWSEHNYWWADAIIPWLRNRLYVLAYNTVEVRRSDEILHRFYQDQLSISDLPMIYNSFIDIELINQVRNQHEKYFVFPELPPDVLSGIINLINSDYYLYSAQPLTVRGNSKKSNGTAHFARAFGAEQREQYYKDEGKTVENIYHASIIPSPNLLFCIANIKLIIKDKFFKDDQNINVDLTLLLKSTISTLNNEPESYEENLEDALRLADKIGFDINTLTIPPKTPISNREPLQGPYEEGVIVVNCDQANIRDIAAAANLAEAISRIPSLNIINKHLMSLDLNTIQKNISRNESCPCGSGRKYKHCHGAGVI